ncbi:hypothetical protein EN828_23760 [Mesorhizobium sp. M2D.F.Ca.ET.185.01.1.1]|uniref:hypothetical protein n=1 Tax=unclassified Mesorhizobium TaxID=325217 RepID=UPI000FCBF809|nr:MULTISPECIES: hypothetical protein [unclassified Mesorhizobium]TGP57402.1 hypothetical protein EN873_04805 [bacterium M00.F.Ca.ET.230.01.1.1]TGP77189.1 hypothetical protein EN870_21555 [bacterium M00.F.Ca.ET.227.01.1.1]TGP84559.1 hypothetical protein EN864_30270 [bacterium M00.F.Ca.ET.221.01.1.1]TGP88706.1 hypothetical protein EN865_27210 [bacterium M00.F.Ca.ET.222.01.1.1]TGT70866.1 hypothetical protein EN802_21370 [bacterium M00.F.Ca.ET.159.01.1.1]TGT82509.1 hypothetical protein EN800_195
MDCFTRLEALIDAGGADAAEEARTLLKHLATDSRAAFDAADEFLIELMTLAFLVEAGLEAFHNPARRLARLRLSRLKLLLP